MDAFNRAGRQAQFAAGALRGNDGVHLLGRANNRIHRAGLDTQRATNAGIFVNAGDGLGLFFGFEWFDLAAKQVGQTLHAFHAAWWAEVDVAFALGDGFGIGLASGVTALATLGLRQDGVDFFDQWVAFNLELDLGKTECGTEENGTESHDGEGEQDIHY